MIHKGRPKGPIAKTLSEPKKKAPAKARVVTKKAYVHELTVLQFDALGLRIAGLPIANKDKDIVVNMLIDELGIKDTDRFWLKVRETNVPTPKT